MLTTRINRKPFGIYGDGREKMAETEVILSPTPDKLDADLTQTDLQL